MHPEEIVSENLLAEHRSLVAPLISKRAHIAEAARLFFPEVPLSFLNASGALAESGKHFLRLWETTLPTKLRNIDKEALFMQDAAFFAEETCRRMRLEGGSVLPDSSSFPSSYFVAYVANRLSEDAFLRFSALSSGALPSRVEGMREAAMNVFHGHAFSAIFPLESATGDFSALLESTMDEFDLFVSSVTHVPNGKSDSAFALLTKNYISPKTSQKGLIVRVSTFKNVPLWGILSVAESMGLHLRRIRSMENGAWKNLSFTLFFDIQESIDVECFLVFLHQFSADCTLLGLHGVS